MKRMQAIKSVRYAKVLRVPGTPTEIFEARPADAKALVAIGKARYAPQDPRALTTATMGRVTSNKALTAQDPGKGGQDSDRYLRRDITTENLANKGLEAEREKARKAAEQRAAEQRAAEQKAAEQKAAEQKAAAKRAESSKGKNEGRSSKTGE